MKRRLAIVTTVHRINDPRIFEREAARAALWGLDVHLFVSVEGPVPQWISTAGISVHRLPTRVGRLRRALLSLRIWGYISPHGPFDVVHFHDPELIPAMIWGKFCKRAHILYDIHEELPLEVFSKNYLPKPLRAIAATGASLLWYAAAAIFDAFAPATEQIATYWPKSRTLVVHNYPQAVLYSQDEPLPDSRRIVFVGMIDELRGIIESIEAVRMIRDEFPDATLELYGPLHNESLASIIAAADFCKYVPWLSKEHAANTLKGAAVGIIPYHHEPCYIQSLPTKMFEYMALGIPQLVSNIPLWSRIISSDEVGISAPPTAEGIAAGLRSMLSHPQELKRWSKNGRIAYFTKYRWESECGNLAHLYVKLGLQLGMNPAS